MFKNLIITQCQGRIDSFSTNNISSVHFPLQKIAHLCEELPNPVTVQPGGLVSAEVGWLVLSPSWYRFVSIHNDRQERFITRRPTRFKYFKTVISLFPPPEMPLTVLAYFLEKNRWKSVQFNIIFLLLMWLHLYQRVIKRLPNSNNFIVIRIYLPQHSGG